jgi:hypothetical protein
MNAGMSEKLKFERIWPVRLEGQTEEEQHLRFRDVPEADGGVCKAIEKPSIWEAGNPLWHLARSDWRLSITHCQNNEVGARPRGSSNLGSSAGSGVSVCPVKKASYLLLPTMVVLQSNSRTWDAWRVR